MAKSKVYNYLRLGKETLQNQLKSDKKVTCILKSEELVIVGKVDEVDACLKVLKEKYAEEKKAVNNSNPINQMVYTEGKDGNSKAAFIKKEYLSTLFKSIFKCTIESDHFIINDDYYIQLGDKVDKDAVKKLCQVNNLDCTLYDSVQKLMKKDFFNTNKELKVRDTCVNRIMDTEEIQIIRDSDEELAYDFGGYIGANCKAEQREILLEDNSRTWLATFEERHIEEIDVNGNKMKIEKSTEQRCIKLTRDNEYYDKVLAKILDVAAVYKSVNNMYYLIKGTCQ